MNPDFIGIYENVLSSEDCQSIIERMEEWKSSGYGIKRPSNNTTRCDESFFDSQQNFLLENQRAAVFQALWGEGYAKYSEEFDILNDFKTHSVDEIKGQITKSGQGYHIWHPEILSANDSNRILSYILYLNDVDEGAETEFLYYKKRVAPKQGRLLLFPAHFTHTHRGNTNLAEHNKYILTGWFVFSHA